jgi:hypothetical protein
MSINIALIIAGIVLTVFALVAGLTSKEEASGLFNPKVKISLGLIGILLIIYGGYFYGSLSTLALIEQASTGNVKDVQYPVTNVQIISPLEGDLVECRTMTKGVYPEPHDKDIWVLVKPSDGKFYPQSDHTNTSYKRDGEWQVITRFGGDKDEIFDIVVYEADSTASAYFSSTIEIWKSNLSYPGLESEELPDGITESDRINVSLKKNCRGIF